MRQRRYQTAGAIVESIIRDMCYTLHQTAGFVGVMPKPLTYVLNNQACRGKVIVIFLTLLIVFKKITSVREFKNIQPLVY